MTKRKGYPLITFFLLKIGVYEWWLYATFGALVSMSSIFVTAKTVL